MQNLQDKVNQVNNFLNDNKNIEEVTLGFSTGKDSLVCLDLLLKNNIRVIPIYFYIVPDLEFINENIKMYEKHFNIKIVKMPHPILKDYIRHQDWQSLHRAKDMVEYRIPKGTFDKSIKWYLDRIGKEIKYDVVGMKECDGLNRRLLLRKINFVKNNKIYLVQHFTKTDIFKYLKSNNIPLTKDYHHFGRSWDGLNYHFTIPVKKYYPKDYEKIKEYFPLIELEILRYEQNKRQHCI